jgi:hypothetical protein
MLRKWSSRSVACYTLVLELFHVLRDHDIYLDVRWVASASNLADLPSRVLLRSVY